MQSCADRLQGRQSRLAAQMLQPMEAMLKLTAHCCKTPVGTLPAAAEKLGWRQRESKLRPEGRAG